MNMTEKIKAFRGEYPALNAEPSVRLMDIGSELGELNKEYLKATDYGARPFALTKGFNEEYGDALYALLTLAEETGVDAEAALDTVLEKYRRRLVEKGAMGSGN